MSKTLARMVRDGELEIRAGISAKEHPTKGHKNPLVEASAEEVARENKRKQVVEAFSALLSD